MTKLYADDEDLFGSPLLNSLTDDVSKEEKQLFKQQKKDISRGYQQILEKIKDLRQGFSKAILNGTRSGSGKIVYEHFDRLKQLWGGCPNTKPLSCGVDTSSVNTNHADGDNSDSDGEEGRLTEPPSLNIELEESSLGGSINSEDPEETTGESSAKHDKQKKKSQDHVAALIDDKRKHLERRLSASQRDAKEDREERKEIRDMMKNSKDSFVHALDNMSQSMLAISNSIAKSMEVIGRGSTPQNNMQPYPAYYINQVQQPQHIPIQQHLLQLQEQEANANEYFELQPTSGSVFYQSMQSSTQRE